MTLLETIRVIERIAAQQPSVNMIVRNDVFRLNACPDAKYGVFAWTQQQHTIGEDMNTFAFAFFYVDRLTEDKANELEVQSVGIQTLGNIIRTLGDAGIFTENDWNAQTFNQRFLDECAGVWATVRLQVPQDWTCPETWPDFNASEFSDDFNIF